MGTSDEMQVKPTGTQTQRLVPSKRLGVYHLVCFPGGPGDCGPPSVQHSRPREGNGSAWGHTASWEKGGEDWNQAPRSSYGLSPSPEPNNRKGCLQQKAGE